MTTGGGTRIAVDEATVRTAQIEIKTLTVRGRQVTMAMYRQIIDIGWLVAPRPETIDMWGTVNYHPDGCKSDDPHRHVVAVERGELRRFTVDAPPPKTMRIKTGDEQEVLKEIAEMSREDRAAWALHLATAAEKSPDSARIRHGDWTITHNMHRQSSGYGYDRGTTTRCGWIGFGEGRQIWRGDNGEVRWSPESPSFPKGESSDDPEPDSTVLVISGPLQINPEHREWQDRKDARRKRETAALLDTLTVRPAPLGLPPSVAEQLEEERERHAEHRELCRQVAALPQLFIAV